MSTAVCFVETLSKKDSKAKELIEIEEKKGKKPINIKYCEGLQNACQPHRLKIDVIKEKYREKMGPIKSEKYGQRLCKIGFI